MTRINHTGVVFLNFFLCFSARDLPVLNAKNKLNFTFYGPQIALLNFLYFQYRYRYYKSKNVSKSLKIVFKVIFLQLIPILKIQKIQKSNLRTIKSEIQLVFRIQYRYISGRKTEENTCVIYPGHKCEILGVEKNQKKKTRSIRYPG